MNNNNKFKIGQLVRTAEDGVMAEDIYKTDVIFKIIKRKIIKQEEIEEFFLNNEIETVKPIKLPKNLYGIFLGKFVVLNMLKTDNSLEEYSAVLFSKEILLLQSKNLSNVK